MINAAVPFRAVLLLVISFPLLMGKCTEEEGKKSDEGGEKGEGVRIGQGLWKIRAMEKGSKQYDFEHSNLLRIKNDSAIELQLKVNECYGSYDIPQPGAIRVGSLSCTEMCCDPKPAKALSRFLSKVDHYQLKEDKLVLLGEGLRIEAVPGTEEER